MAHIAVQRTEQEAMDHDYPCIWCEHGRAVRNTLSDQCRTCYLPERRPGDMRGGKKSNFELTKDPR